MCVPTPQGAAKAVTKSMSRMTAKTPAEAPRMPETPLAPGGVSTAASSARARRRAAGSSTILTGPLGVTSQAATGVKTLLGQ